MIHAVWRMSCLTLTLTLACSSNESSQAAQPLTPSVDAGDGSDEIERRIKSLDLNPKDADEEARWLDSKEFSLSFDAGSCFGTCPSYKYTIDHVGHLHFEGLRYVARPGVYDAELSDVRQGSLFYSLIQSGFLRLNDRYAEEADGCLPVTDLPQYSMRIEIPGHAKAIDYYRGCLIKGPAYEALQSSVDAFERWIADRHFTEPNPQDCSDEWRLEHALHQSYVLLDTQERPAGLLRVGPVPNERYEPRMWQVLTCAGEELYAGKTGRSRGCEPVLLPGDNQTFAWPGIERPINAAILQPQDTSTHAADLIEVLALDATSEVHMQARSADACESL